MKAEEDKTEWVPTMHLRWVYSWVEDRKLEQLWTFGKPFEEDGDEEWPGNYREEWRPIPRAED